MDIQNCKLCDLCIKRNKVVEGYGNINSNIMFLFDHPRFKQDKTGIIYSNDDTRKFIGYCFEYNFTEINSYFTYLVKCRPTSEKAFYNSIGVCSSNHLSREYLYNGIKKKIIVAIGPSVSNYLLGGKKFRYFGTFTSAGTIIIPVPNVRRFVEESQIRMNLSIIKGVYEITK